jgi:dienelactone hydrolase
VPYLNNWYADDWKAPDGTVASSYRRGFHDAVAAAAPDVLAAATIHVESTNGPILMVGGDDDQVWPSCELQKIAMDRLVAAGHASKYADEATCYPASGHASGWTPGASTFEDLTAAVPGDVLALGGTAAGVAKAQRDSFTRVTSFLAKALK